MDDNISLELRTNRIFSILKNSYFKFKYAIEFIFALIFSIGIFNLIYYKQYFSFVHGKYLILTVFVAILLFFIICYDIKINYKKIENLFLAIAIPIGLLYIIFLLPTYIPDEQAHLFRAYDISKGVIITNVKIQREFIPSDIRKLESQRINSYNELPEKIYQKTDHNSKTEELFNSAEAYSFIMYIFSSLACLISRVFSLNLYIMVYLARIFNFIFFLIMGYYTIKVLPFGKLVMFVYLLNPVLMQEAMSVSADSFINATTLMFIAYNLHILFTKKKLSKKQKIIYATLVVCISFSKYVYFPLVFITILLFFNKSAEYNKDKFFIVMIIISIILAIICCYIGVLYKDIRSYVIENNINSLEQVKYILRNPINYILTLINTMKEYGKIYVYQFLGYNFVGLNIDGNKMISALYLLLLLASPFLEKNEKSLNLYQKIWCLFMVFGIIILVMTGLYIAWTTVNGNVIQGVQGRYFLPIIILALLCLVKKGKYIEFKYTNFVVLFALCCVNYIGLGSIIKFFIV